MFTNYSRLCFKRIFRYFEHYETISFRENHSENRFYAEKLTGRKVVRVSGESSAEFLQGLTTNDVQLLNTENESIYTLFLNNKGRVLFDSIVYKGKESDTFHVECASDCLQLLVKHLNLYKVRRKVDITSLESELCVWSVYNPKLVEAALSNTLDKETKDTFCDVFDRSVVQDVKALVTPDPRLPVLGYRVIVRSEQSLINLPLADSYKMLRYKCGIGEGPDELLVAQSFPFENNCDYLNGISFDKGCYIGQELTARTYHTGVVRKRLMPLVFQSELHGIPFNTPIEDSETLKKSPIGQIRAYDGIYGLGLMRVADTLETKSLKLLDSLATSHLPFWWPQESIHKNYVKLLKK